MDNIFRIGMPIEGQRVECPEDGKKYDFFMISGAAWPNVNGAKLFLQRVVPLLAPRKVRFALVGNICKGDSLFDASVCPPNCEMVKLGFIDDVDRACAESRVGVAVVTAAENEGELSHSNLNHSNLNELVV